MPSLLISDFSCIKSANFEIAPLTVIIGPQGSGKSVTTKLSFFFLDILNNFIQAAERGDTIDTYKVYLNKTFNLWFPASAWGVKRFNINFNAGPFSVRLLRRMVQGRPSDVVAVTFSDWFNDIYEDARTLFAQSEGDRDIELDNDPNVLQFLDRVSRIREIISDRMARGMMDEYVSQQTFIPAGRAFFTSVGRLMAGFEQAGSLDPVTIKFARLFANLKDRNTRFGSDRLFYSDEDLAKKRIKIMDDLFGGEVKFDSESDYVQTKDGRKVPFTFLSSGQQELLPMWSLIDYFGQLDSNRFLSRRGRASRKRQELLYIEEPEAHLFPSAQSVFMEFLMGFIANERAINKKRLLVLTTHSPYIMSKLNVFMKAGQLSRRKKRNQKIHEIVPRECWLVEGQLAAYAIEGGVMTSLLDEDGLIDGTYLDAISEDISRDFSSLLKIEAEVSGL